MSSHETRSKFNKNCKVKRIQVNPGKSSYYSSLNLKQVSTKLRKCSICKKEFQRSAYFRHLLIHSQQKPHKCKYCSTGFIRLDNCRDHEHRNHKFSCGLNSCNVAFTNKRMLTRHRRTEHKYEGKIVSNNDNEQKFSQDINFSHTAQPRSSLNLSTYKCNFCDNHFFTREDQEAHQNSHDDDETEPETEEDTEDSNYSDIDVAGSGQQQPKFHDCQLCERAFLSEAALLSHVQSHVQYRHSVNNNSKLNSNMVLKKATVRVFKIKSDENNLHNEIKTEAVRKSLPTSLRRSSPPTAPVPVISSNERKRGHGNLFLRRRNSKSEENGGGTRISSSNKTNNNTDIYEFKDEESDDSSIYKTYNLRQKERINYSDDLIHSEGSKEQKLSKSLKENQERPTTHDTITNKVELIKLIKNEKEVAGTGTVNSNFESRITSTTTTTAKRIKVATKTNKLKKKLPRSVVKAKNKINTASRASNICPFCKRKFKGGSYKLKLHIRVHTGEKPHACQFPNCGKAFSQRHTLIQHIRVHTGERPYPCTLCPASFATLGVLKSHKLSTHQSTHPPVYKLPRLQKGRALDSFQVENTNSSREGNINSKRNNEIENRGHNNMTKTEPEPDSDSNRSGRQLKMKQLNSKLSLPNTLKVRLEKVLVPQTQTQETHHASIRVETNAETKVDPEIIKEAQRNYYPASIPKARRHTIIGSQFRSQSNSLQKPKLQTESHYNNSYSFKSDQEGPTKTKLGRTILGISEPVSNSKLYVAPKCPKSKLSKSFQASSLKSSAGLMSFPKPPTTNLPECIRQNLNYNILEYICEICSSKFAYRVDAVEHARRTHAVHC